MKPHKHAALIKEWADGARIQYETAGVWYDVPEDDIPMWMPNKAYRVKPEPKPDVIITRQVAMCVNKNGTSYFTHYCNNSNVEYTFDGDTLKLKSVKLI